mgnify:CR=1 FL=1
MATKVKSKARRQQQGRQPLSSYIPEIKSRLQNKEAPSLSAACRSVSEELLREGIIREEEVESSADSLRKTYNRDKQRKSLDPDGSSVPLFHHGNRLLSVEDEDLLVGVLRGFILCGTPALFSSFQKFPPFLSHDRSHKVRVGEELTWKDVHDIAHDVFPGKGANAFGKHWCPSTSLIYSSFSGVFRVFFVFSPSTSQPIGSYRRQLMN